MCGKCWGEVWDIEVPDYSRNETRATRRSRSLDRERRRSERRFEGRGTREPREDETPPGLTRPMPVMRTARQRRATLLVMFQRLYGEMAERARNFVLRHESEREQQIGDVVLFEDDEAGPMAILLIERITEDRWLTLEVKQIHRAEDGDTIVQPVGRSFFPRWCVTTSHRSVMRIASDDKRLGWIDEKTVELVLGRAQNESFRARWRDDDDWPGYPEM